MVQQEQSPEFQNVLRQGQVIIGALTAGILLFMLIILFVLGTGFEPLAADALISIVMAALAIGVVPARLVVPGLIITANCQQIARETPAAQEQSPSASEPAPDEGKLLQAYLATTIVGAAFLEGAAFGNLVAFMLEGQIYSLLFAILFMLGILAGIPTADRLSDWLRGQQRRVQEMRSLGS
jgi:uncharacterized membrane protein (DUF485 family)